MYRLPGRFTFERIRNTKEQTYFYERAESYEAKERMFKSFKSANFQVNIPIQGWINDSWNGDL